MHMMPQLMSQHHFNLIRCVAIQHGITQHNTPRVTQPHQSRIGCRRLATHVHGKDSPHAGVSPIRQGQESLRQLAFRQWRKFVKQRQNEYRCQIRHYYREEQQNQRNFQPPRLRLRCQQEIDQFDNDGFQN